MRKYIYRFLADLIIVLYTYSSSNEQFLWYAGWGYWLDECARDKDILLE